MLRLDPDLPTAVIIVMVDASGKVRIGRGVKTNMRGEWIYTKWTWPVKGVTGL